MTPINVQDLRMSCIFMIFSLIFFVLFTGAFFVFIHMQFRSRWEADEKIRALHWLKYELLQSPSQLEKRLKEVPPMISFDDEKLFPPSISFEISGITEETIFQKHTACNLLKNPRKLKARSELSSYVLLLLATLTAWTVLWWWPIPEKTEIRYMPAKETIPFKEKHRHAAYGLKPVLPLIPPQWQNLEDVGLHRTLIC